jgi:predicted GIY-YIG superfamily endonuclease
VNELPAEERVAIVDLADDLKVRKQRIFKILPRLGIRPTQRREQSRGNQNIATVCATEAAAIRAEIVSSSDPSGTGASALPGSVSPFYSDDGGFFYVIQLEPDHDPGRFKVGFTMDLDARLQRHRCAAPFAQYLNTWPCKRIWERAAIDRAAEGCERLHTEVFRASSLDHLHARTKAFFAVMPKLAVDSGDQQDLDPAGRAG